MGPILKYDWHTEEFLTVASLKSFEWKITEDMMRLCYCAETFYLPLRPLIKFH